MNIEFDKYRKDGGFIDLVDLFLDNFKCQDNQMYPQIIERLRFIESIQPIRSRQVAACILGNIPNIKLK